MSNYRKWNWFAKIPSYVKNSLIVDKLMERRLSAIHGRPCKGRHRFAGLLENSMRGSLKSLGFFWSPKIFFQAVNYLNSRWEIHGNYPDGGKISLKIKLASFMLIMRPDKFHGILIAEGPWIEDIPFKFSMWWNLRGVDWHPRSAQSRNIVNKDTFFSLESLPKNSS